MCVKHCPTSVCAKENNAFVAYFDSVESTNDKLKQLIQSFINYYTSRLPNCGFIWSVVSLEGNKKVKPMDFLQLC